MDRLIHLSAIELRLSWRVLGRRTFSSAVILGIALLLYGLFEWFKFVEAVRAYGSISVHRLITVLAFAWVAWIVYSNKPLLLPHLIQAKGRIPLSQALYFAVALFQPLSVLIASFLLSGFWILFGQAQPGWVFLLKSGTALIGCTALGIALSRLLDGSLYGKALFRLGSFLQFLATLVLLVLWSRTGLALSATLPGLDIHIHLAVMGFVTLAGLILIAVSLQLQNRINYSSFTMRFRTLTFIRWIPTGAPELLAKDLRLLFSGLEPWVALGVAYVGTWQLATQAHDPVYIASVALTMIALFLAAPATVASFGMEAKGSLRRYRLLHLSGRELFKSKNCAYFLASGLTAAIVAAPLLKSNPLAVLNLCVIVAVTSLVHVLWGNQLTLRHDIKRLPYRFVSLSLEHTHVLEIVSYLACGLPALLIVVINGLGHPLASTATGAALLLLGTLVYRRALGHQGAALEEWLRKKTVSINAVNVW